MQLIHKSALGSDYSRASFIVTWNALSALSLMVIFGGSSEKRSLFDIICFGWSLMTISGLYLTRVEVRRRGSPVLVASVCLTAAYTLLQAMPLPWGLWTLLPGRELSATIFSLVGLAGHPHSISLDPYATLRSALALLPAVAVYLSFMRMESHSLPRFVCIILGLSVLSLTLGILQLTSPGWSFLMFFETSHQGLPLGLFANANHQGDLLIIGVVCCAYLYRWANDGSAPARLSLTFGILAIAAMLGVGVILTSSRMAILLLALSLLAIIIRQPSVVIRRRLIISCSGIFLAVMGLSLVNSRMSSIIRDFLTLQDARTEFWMNVVHNIYKYAPLGSGLGTFDIVYRSSEPLSSLSLGYVNHAHNDYLEFLLECGIVGLVILLTGLIGLVRAAVRYFCSTKKGIDISGAAMICVGIVLIHSFVDYPLRTTSLSVVFAAFSAIFVSARATPKAA